MTSPGGTVNGGHGHVHDPQRHRRRSARPQTANVSTGTASTSYPLPAGTAIGTYTIQAVYNGTTDFGGSSDSTHSLIVTLPPAAKLVIQTEPSSTATAGQPFATASRWSSTKRTNSATSRRAITARS